MTGFFQIEGEVYKLNPVKVIGDNGFQVRTIGWVIRAENGWDSYFETECKFEAIEQTKNLEVGEICQLKCYIGGRRWTKEGDTAANERIFTTVSCTECRPLEYKETLTAKDAVETTGGGDLPF